VHFSNDGTEFGGSIYQKVNSNLEMAINLAWTAGSNNTRFEIGAKHQLDKDTSLSVSMALKIHLHVFMDAQGTTQQILAITVKVL